MYKFFRYSCVLIFSFLLHSNAFGYTSLDNPEGIYLCTKDIDRPESLVSSNIGDNYFYEHEFLPFEDVAESGKKHQFGRHCFMLHAKYKETIVEPDGTKKLSIS